MSCIYLQGRGVFQFTGCYFLLRRYFLIHLVAFGTSNAQNYAKVLSFFSNFIAFMAKPLYLAVYADYWTCL